MAILKAKYRIGTQHWIRCKVKRSDEDRRPKILIGTYLIVTVEYFILGRKKVHQPSFS